MGFIDRFFGKRGESSSSLWYIAENKDKHVRQVVLKIPASAQVSPQVSNLVPPSAHFQFMQANWASITLFMDNYKYPIVFVRAEGYVDYFRGCSVRVAFAFYCLSFGGLFDVLTHVHCPSVEQRTGNPCVFENPHNLSGSDDSKKMASSLLEGDALDICFVANGVNGPCTGYFGLRVPIPTDCRAALKKEMNALIEYHQALSPSMHNFQAAITQFERENPLKENPVLHT